MRWRHRGFGDRGESGGPVRKAAPAHSLADNEFDAFLSGTYADWLLAHRQAVPAWAWVNRLAHATVGQLEEYATASAPAHFQDEAAVWELLNSFLSQEVLARAGDDARLEILQREILVPTELRLAEKWWATVAPVDLATAVLVALHNFSIAHEDPRSARPDDHS